MYPPTKKVRIREVAAAMVEDTTPQVTKSYINKHGACAIGGAAMILGLRPDSLHGRLDDMVRPYIDSGHSVSGLNDLLGMSKSDIGHSLLGSVPPDVLDSEIEVARLSDKHGNTGTQTGVPFIRYWHQLMQDTQSEVETILVPA